MSKKHKEDFITLIYIEHLLVLLSSVTGCASVSSFPSLVGNPTGVECSTVALRTCLITAEIKKFKSIIKKKRRNQNKKVLLATAKLKTMEVLISWGLTNSYVSQSEFFSVSIVLRAKKKFI